MDQLDHQKQRDLSTPLHQLQVGVYGMGRFGSFWARTLAAGGLKVAGYNRSDRPFPEGVERCTEEQILQCDVLFFCVAISAFGPLLEKIGPAMGKHTLVFDTCSVKVHPMEMMERYLPAESSFIGTHPMFGPDSGRYGVAGLPIVFSPGRCRDETARRWVQFFASLGLKVLEISAENHDREAAYTQGITHVIGRVLGGLSLQESEIATKGYQRLLQVRDQTCNDPLQLFMDLQHYNPYTHTMRLELVQAVERTMKLLAQADSQG